MFKGFLGSLHENLTWDLLCLGESRISVFYSPVMVSAGPGRVCFCLEECKVWWMLRQQGWSLLSPPHGCCWSDWLREGQKWQDRGFSLGGQPWRYALTQLDISGSLRERLQTRAWSGYFWAHKESVFWGPWFYCYRQHWLELQADICFKVHLKLACFSCLRWEIQNYLEKNAFSP